MEHVKRMFRFLNVWIIVVIAAPFLAWELSEMSSLNSGIGRLPDDV